MNQSILSMIMEQPDRKIRYGEIQMKPQNK